jgi:hypothetical protein
MPPDHLTLPLCFFLAHTFNTAVYVAVMDLLMPFSRRIASLHIRGGANAKKDLDLGEEKTGLSVVPQDWAIRLLLSIRILRGRGSLRGFAVRIIHSLHSIYVHNYQNGVVYCVNIVVHFESESSKEPRAAGIFPNLSRAGGTILICTPESRRRPKPEKFNTTST